MTKYFTKPQIEEHELEIVNILAQTCATNQDKLHKGDLKREIHKFYQNVYHDSTKKVDRYHFEALLRKAEKQFLIIADMSYKSAKAGVMARMLSISCDPGAQNRDKIMADQLISNMAGLDAKYSGGFDDDNTDEVAEIIAEIAEDAKHGEASQ